MRSTPFPSFRLGFALQVVAATVALKGSVIADDDFPVAPIEIVHGCDREIVDCRETVGDDVADQLLQHLLLLGRADLLISPDVEVVTRDSAARVVLLFSLLATRICVMNQVIVAVSDVHTGFAGVQRLLARRGKEVEDLHDVFVAGGVRLRHDDMHVVLAVLALAVLVGGVLAVRIGELEQIIDGFSPVRAHVLLIENRPPVPSLCDFRSLFLFFGHKNGALSNRGKRLQEV